MQKYIWGFAAITLLAAFVWLARVMPNQAWAEWDGHAFQLVQTGWGTLLAAWPIALFGILIGAVIGGAGIGIGLQIAKEHDYLDQIARLEMERDNAVSKAESRVKLREAEAIEQKLAAIAAEQRAIQEVAEAKAAQAQSAANTVYVNQELEKANYRIKNAVAAANRIKKKSTRS